MDGRAGGRGSGPLGSLGGVALAHARRLETLPVAERVAVLREIARLLDVEPWVRVATRPDRRTRSLEGEGR